MRSYCTTMRGEKTLFWRQTECRIGGKSGVLRKLLIVEDANTIIIAPWAEKQEEDLYLAMNS